MKELWDGVDIHAVNQATFNLPSRIVAKTFKFRLLYGGSCWSFAKDKDFNWISKDADFWQEVIDGYYNKYQGIAVWHDRIVQDAARDGKLVMPTGRVYTYQPYWKRDQWVWPRTTILNYPVQGLGQDLMAIARVSAYRRVDQGLFINTVHDSIVLDISGELCDNVCRILDQVFKDIPKNFERLFGVEFNLPMKAEIKYGPNWAEMEKWEG